MTKKRYGFEGTITPINIVKGLTESWTENGIFFSIGEGVFKVVFDCAEQREEAKKIAKSYIDTWNFKNNAQLSVDFNHSWKPLKEEGAHHNLKFTEKITLKENLGSIHRTSSERGVYVVGKRDSNSFAENSALVEKSCKNDALRKAIEFYSEEAVNEKRPLYGIYKAIEVLTKELEKKHPKKGRKKLGEIAEKNEKFVKAIMERTQLQRHAITPARNLLTEKECKHRAKILIQAYADFI